MSRIQQDSVIDDDEETCPLCIEEFDLSDKNFRPCPCGYQICQFCFNSLKTTYEKSNCPNCRRPYDEKTIQYKIPTAEEFKLDQQNKIRKQAATKRKETEKREIEPSSRRNLAGVRVKQTNLVYVIGLIPTIKDETSLLQTLRGTDYFGQYGEIEKIVVSKAKASSASQGIGVYVTYARKEDAALCIQTVDGSMNGERVLRAQYGTTKYCSAFLRGEVCNNKNCSFLHETGEEGQTSSLQNELNGKVIPKPLYPSQPSQMPAPSRPTPPIAPASIASQPMARQNSKEESDSRQGSIDASALPSSASWANSNPQVTKNRRASQSVSNSTPSPSVTNAVPSISKRDEAKTRDSASSTPAQTQSQPSAATQKPATVAPPPGLAPSSKPQSDPFAANKALLNSLIQRVSSTDFRFVFDESAFSPDELTAIDQQPILIDPYGGAKRRIMMEKEKAEQERLDAEAQANQEAQAQTQQSPGDEHVDDENIGSGSLALGGEPEDDLRGASSRGAIQRPPQTNSVNNFINEQFSNMNINGRSFTPQQRQVGGLTGSGYTQRALGLSQPLTATSGSELFDFDQRGIQYPAQNQYDAIHGHQRQNSRYFSNETSKPAANSRFTGQQQFYSSGVQGPPPGLPTAGTPPVSGGGMFAHGQGFTSNAGFGGLKDGNSDMHLRNRSGTNDISKRESLLSLQNNPLRSPQQAPVPGLLNPLYGRYAGAYQDPGLVKQKKKGKKHRHANTSSSGGGVVDLADPSILQARVHQGGSGTGQGLFGGHQVDEKEFPALPGSTTDQARPIHSRVSSFQTAGRSVTPKVPPGFELPHSHPSPPASPIGTPHLGQKTPATGPVLPAVPILPIGQRAPTPRSKLKEIAVNTSGFGKSLGSTEPNAEDPSVPVVKKVNEISLGSPKPKAAQMKSVIRKAEPKVEIQASSTPEDNQPSFPTDISHEEPSTSKRPGKIEILPTPVAISALSESVGLENTPPVIASDIVATPPAMSSRPSTPATIASQVSRGSRPMTIRVTTSMPRQTNDSAPPSAVTERSITNPLYSAHSQLKQQAQRSRAQSITSAVSQSRPSTPAMSDRFSMTNDMLSRASSPPPSIVGSAPERTKTKAQQKKERKEKAKKATETSEAGTSSATATPPVVEEVAPVLGRQRKVKKHQPGTGLDGAKEERLEAKAAKTEDSDLAEQAREAGQQSQDSAKAKATAFTSGTKHTAQTIPNAKKKDSKRTDGSPANATTPAMKEHSKPAKTEGPQRSERPHTLLDLYTESAKYKNDPQKFQKLLNEHLSSTNQLFGSLIDSKDIEPTSALFGNQPSFNSGAFKLPPDSRKGAEYLDANGYTDSNPFGQIYLGPKEKKALWNGESFGVADEREGRQGDLLRRALVTGGGVVYRHLTREQEDRVMELEARKEHYAAQWGIVGGIGNMDGLKRLEADDYINIEGGVEDLIRHGDRHGIGWIMGQNHEDWDDDADPEDEEGDQFEDDYEDEDDKTDDLGLGLDPTVAGWEAATATGVMPPTLSTANAKQASTIKIAAPSSNVNLRAMDYAQLQKRIKDSQQIMEAAKKELEKIDKLMQKKTKEVGKWREGVTGLKI